MNEYLVEALKELLSHLPAEVRAWVVAFLLVSGAFVAITWARYKWGKGATPEAMYLQERYERLLNMNKQDQAALEEIRGRNRELRKQIMQTEDERNQAKRKISDLEWRIIQLQRELGTEQTANQILGYKENNDETH